MPSFARAAVVVATLAVALAGQAAPSLFDRATAVLAERYFDRAFRDRALVDLIARYRPAAVAAATAAEERAVLHALLAEVPASHLALLSAATHARFEAELAGRRTPMFGCALLQRGGRFFVDSVYEGGAAHAAGLRAGEEVLSIDGVPVGASERLDWRSDDAHLADPPVHDLLAADGEVATFAIAGAPPRTVTLLATRWSALQASEASVRSLHVRGRTLLHVHLWFVFHARAGRLVTTALREHADAEGLVLDLRGRGGSALECAAIVRAVGDAANRGVPTVALVDGRTRSAKEVVAADLSQRALATLVGERTAGAVLPASFAPLGDGAVLMLPEGRLGAHSNRLEGHGVEPDVAVAVPIPPRPGEDPVLRVGIDTLVRLLETPTGR